MSFMSRITNGSAVKPAPPKTSTSTLALTSRDTQDAWIQKYKKEIVADLIKEKQETLAWIVSMVEVSPTTYGTKALQASIGKIVFNATYSARLTGMAERKKAVEDAILEALPGLNMGGASAGPDKTKLEEAIAGLVAALDNVIEVACPGYSESAPLT